MKTIKVVAAVICDSLEITTKIFATARGYGQFKGQWEFPGGKVEVGETAQQALIREIQEELAVKIKVDELIDTIEYDYPTFHLSMDCYLCNIEFGRIVLREAEAAKWLNKENLRSVNWLPADRVLVDKIEEISFLH
ncbi:MAG: (deoxy)nucleoside triphosphate pyrophosphohydrolase [Acutalibacteraceae bacterium]